MQAAYNKDHPVPHQDASPEFDRPVSFHHRHLTSEADNRPTMVGVKKKLERREKTRERKALAAAHIEKTIEKELLDRLRSKAYGDAPLNVNEDVWRQVLEMDRKGKEKELDMDEMMDDESDLDEEEEEYEGGEREYVEADDSDDDMEDFSGVSLFILVIVTELMIV
jgi:hypothetical protein